MVVLFIPESVSTFEKKVQQLNKVRLARSCVEAIVGDGENEGGHPFLDSYLPFAFTVQIGIIASGILVIILTLGVIKGLMGLFIYPPIGMLGLGYLVDLPRVLNKYQESELAQMRVVYDSVGWPIHPQTGKRTVRAVTKRTEFCINVVFFIAFPLVIIISIFILCFVHKTYDEDDGGECYQTVNTIMLSDTPSLKVLAKGCTTKGVGGSYKADGNQPCPTKGKVAASVASSGCNKNCKHAPSKNVPKSSSTPTNSKSKSSSSGTGKSALKSPKSSAKSDSSSKSNKSKSKSKSKTKKTATKSKKPKSKGSTKSSKQKRPSKSNSTYKDNDSAEDADTQYVLDQMKESEMSLGN